MRLLSSHELQEALAEPVAAVAAPVAHATAPGDHVCEGWQEWNEGRESVQRQAYRVFNETRVAKGKR
jgi:hypothetical protein